MFVLLLCTVIINAVIQGNAWRCKNISRDNPMIRIGLSFACDNYLTSFTLGQNLSKKLSG